MLPAALAWLSAALELMLTAAVQLTGSMLMPSNPKYRDKSLPLFVAPTMPTTCLTMSLHLADKRNLYGGV